MKREEIYKAIVAIKEKIFMKEEVESELLDIRSADALIKRLLDTYYKGDTIVKRVAFATVVVAGCFWERGGFSFGMPATKDCMSCYKYVKKACRRHETLYLTIIKGEEYTETKIKF